MFSCKAGELHVLQARGHFGVSKVMVKTIKREAPEVGY